MNKSAYSKRGIVALCAVIYFTSYFSRKSFAASLFGMIEAGAILQGTAGLVDREIFHRDNYYIIAFVPTESNRDIKLNQYGNFTCCGDIGYITLNKDYELEVEEGKTSKYGVSYNILSVPSLQMEDLSKLSEDDKFAILMECTSSERIARNILRDCPNYIELAVTKGEEAIDTSKIFGIGKAYNKCYCRILNDKYKYYAFCCRPFRL